MDNKKSKQSFFEQIKMSNKYLLGYLDEKDKEIYLTKFMYQKMNYPESIDEPCKDAQKLYVLSEEKPFDDYFYQNNRGANIVDVLSRIKPCLLSVPVIVAESSGGNYLGDVSAYEKVEYSIPKLVSLHQVMLDLFPDTKYSDYYQIESRISELDYRVNEYYGNHREYKILYILLEDILKYV